MPWNTAIYFHLACRVTLQVYDGLPARIGALRSKDRGWQTVGVGGRGNGVAMT